MAHSGGTLYLGGSFRLVAPVTGGAARVDPTSGLLVAGFPKVLGDVYAVAPDLLGGWYIGGTFTSVGGLPRSNLAHILSNHTVGSWNPDANGEVRAIALSGSTVYVGGDFTSVGGQPRDRIAALEVGTGIATVWNPGASQTVRALAVKDSLIYVGGTFSTISGQVRNRIAAVGIEPSSPSFGVPTGWNPNAGATVFTLQVDGPTIYAGGAFTSIGGQTRNYIAALDGATGAATSWNPNANSVVYALMVMGSKVYFGGSFTAVGGQTRNRVAAVSMDSGSVLSWNANVGGSVYALDWGSGGQIYLGGTFLSVASVARNFAAAVDTASGALTAWNPSPNGGVYALAARNGFSFRSFLGGGFNGANSQLRNNLAALDAATGAATSWNPNASGDVYALAVRDTIVYVGGAFTGIGGMSRARIAAVGATNGLPTAWNPGANGAVRALQVAALGDSASASVRLYAGGSFTTIGGQTLNRIAALDLANGSGTSWNPGANGTVYALAVDHPVVYAGGDFTTMGGMSRSCVAAVNTVTGAATAWAPNADTTVFALAVKDTLVYAGGVFQNIGGQPRNRIAALGAASGVAIGWNPNANGIVYGLATSGSVVYAGGRFTDIGGQPRDHIAALDGATGLAHAWNPAGEVPISEPAPYDVASFAVTGTTVYAAGFDWNFGGTAHSHVVAIPAALVLDAVNPASGGHGGTATLTVSGAGMQDGATIRLTHPVARSITGTQVVVAADGSSLTGTFRLSNAVVGVWDVTVTNPDSQVATLSDAFTVEALETPQLRVDVVGPPLIRADRRTPFDLVIQNEGNVDAVAVPLWITGIPAGATLEPDFTVTPPTREAGEPDWSLVPLTLPGASGGYTALVIPRIPPGMSTRRIHLSVPGTVPTFALRAAAAPPWLDRPELRTCLFQAGVIQQAQCMGAQLTAVHDTLVAQPELEAVSGIGVWAKIAWQCEGGGTLPAAVAKAEQVLDYMGAAVEQGTASGVCSDVLRPWWRDTLAVTLVSSVDPNDKLGPHGTISQSQAIPYSIRFENLETATADAQQVVIVDALDLTTLDPTTVSLDAITFGATRIVPPPGLASYATEVDLRPQQNLKVRVSVTVDRYTGVVVWTLTSIDPATGLIPLLEGFLPPNQSPPQGEGSVLFTVRPRTLADSTEILNDAVITFDGVSQTTPEYALRIDAAPPASAVMPLSSPADSTRFTVRWAGLGEDLKDYTIYVSEDDGPYRAWRQNTVATADTFVSNPGGHQYAFYSVARDGSGNVEAAPPTPDAQTYSPTAVEEAGAWRLGLEGARPNPAVGSLRVGFTLANRERAVLELLDVAGRRVARREVGTLGPGRHTVTLGTPQQRPGLYFVRLVQGARVLNARVALMR